MKLAASSVYYICKPILMLALNQYPLFTARRGVDQYERLNRVEEGMFGVVYRAKDKRNGLVDLFFEKKKNAWNRIFSSYLSEYISFFFFFFLKKKKKN